MANYIRAANPIWYFVDLQGLGLNDEYYAFFLQNTFPYLPQPVYQDPNASNEWANPLQFQPSGTLPNNLYFNDELTYRIEIRHGNSQTDPLVWLIENFVPGGESVTPVSNELISLNNVISNSQFSEVSFTGTLTVSSPGIYNVAPGWTLELTGGGNASVQQIVTLANEDEVNDPPYALRITTNGVTTAELVQTFDGTGVLFSSVTGLQDGYAAASVTARGISGDYPLTINYETDNLTEVPIATGTALLNSFTVVDGIDLIPVSTNSDLNSDTAVYFIVVLQTTGTLEISNVQMTGQLVPAGSSIPSVPLYQQEPLERQVDHLFHYYKNSLLYAPIPSHLVGWDFPLNPAQFLGNTVAASAIGANKSKYVWDQTIIFQSANSGVSVTRGSAGELVLTAAVTTKMAIIQYLPATQARKILNDAIAVNLSAISTGQSITATISLWYTTDASLPNINTGTNNSLVLTLGSNGKPATFNGTWTEVPRTSIGQDAVATITTTINTNFHDYNFNGWNTDGIAGNNTATFFAIVIGTGSVTAGNTLHVNSVGLMSGNVATRPAPQTPDQVLRECEFYYEKSYVQGVIPGTSDARNLTSIPGSHASLTFSGGNQTYTIFPNSIQWEYKEKRVLPTVSTFQPLSSNTAGMRFQFVENGLGGTNPMGSPLAFGNTIAFPFTLNSSGTDRISYRANNAAQVVVAGGVITVSFLESYIQFHWTLDARLGVV